MKFNINEAIFKKSLLFFLIGLLFIIFQGNSLNIITSIIGGLLIVMGILNIIKKKDLTSNVVLIVVGAVIIIFGWLLIEFVMLFCGILLVFKSVSELVLYKNINIVNSVITLAAGIMMMEFFTSPVSLMAGLNLYISSTLTLYALLMEKSVCLSRTTCE